MLREAEAGAPVKDCWCQWSHVLPLEGEIRGLEVNETRRLRQENGRLKRIVTQQALDLDALKVVLAKKW